MKILRRLFTFEAAFAVAWLIFFTVYPASAWAEDKPTPKTTEEQLVESKKTVADQEKAIQWLTAKVKNLQQQLQGLGAYCNAATAAQGIDAQMPAIPPPPQPTPAH